MFVVIFAMLLISVTTISFLRIMLTDQQQAADNDLSRSAYDSATSGVEDAKRAMLRYQKYCATSSASNCALANAKIASNFCNVGVRFQASNISTPVTGNEAEEPIVQYSGDNALQQAYTCVTMQLNTNDYVGSISEGESKLVPLIGVSDFSAVTVKWFSKNDLSTPTNVTEPAGAASRNLPAQSAWGANTPSLMRAQLMQFGSDFTLPQFDAVTAAGQSNANTVFLYPVTSAVGANNLSFADRDFRAVEGSADGLPASSTGPAPIRCLANIADGGYSCTANITLPDKIGAGTRTAFLRLSALYNATHFQVLLDGGAVQFKEVQPIVDSTGRANDVYRRVASRVDLYDTNFPYPDASVDISSGNFCKDFSVTDTQYIAGSCRP